MFTHSNILFCLGLIGLGFYIIAPIFFPHVDNIRQPELLPVYSLMIGLGGLLRKDAEKKDDKDGKTDTKH